MGSPVPATRTATPDLDIDLVMSVGMAGALGSLLRWLLAEVWPVLPGEFPWATLIVNVVGSALLGMLVGLRLRWPVSGRTYQVLTVGFLGGFTTFSTYTLQGLWLLERAHYLAAGAWLLGSVAAGLVAAGLGWLLGRRLSGTDQPVPAAPMGTSASAAHPLPTGTGSPAQHVGADANPGPSGITEPADSAGAQPRPEDPTEDIGGDAP